MGLRLGASILPRVLNPRQPLPRRSLKDRRHRPARPQPPARAEEDIGPRSIHRASGLTTTGNARADFAAAKGSDAGIAIAAKATGTGMVIAIGIGMVIAIGTGIAIVNRVRIVTAKASAVRKC
jgi:murein DD-endopeptidase MepM/ murein hydrolase activator NlpD